MAKSKNKLSERLAKGPVLCAEGYLFELERRGYLKAGAYVPEVVLDHPEVVEQLHREFLRAGSDVIEAFTYYAHRDKLRLIDREKDLEQLNRQALRIAKKVANEDSALLAGNICNTWVYDPDDHKKTSQTVRQMYEEQVGWAAEEGVDFVIAETIEYVGEALIALEVIKEHGLPAVVTFGAAYEKSKDGYDWIEGCKLLEANDADVVGFNCIRGPETMLPLLKKLRKAVKCPIAALPVPYHTTPERPAFQFLKRDNSPAFPVLLDDFTCNRNDMARFTLNARDLGVEYLGICCGAGPHHVRAMAEGLGRKVPASEYSPDLSLHGMIGNAGVVKKHEKKFLAEWK